MSNSKKFNFILTYFALPRDNSYCKATGKNNWYFYGHRMRLIGHPASTSLKYPINIAFIDHAVSFLLEANRK